MTEGATPASSDRAADGFPMEVARKIRLVVFDVDGVLTDAGVYLGQGPGGEAIELKRFDIQDGLALKLLKGAGLEVALVSGRVSPSTAIRAEELGIECHQDDGARKVPIVKRIMDRVGLDWSEVAALGDDLPDLPLLRKVGLPVAVANAVPEVMSQVAWSTRLSGGRGAVREFVRDFLLARDAWTEAVEGYCAERSDE
jgi:3-deoxy-D-manno-octulosonate 8-phosphate phosphatase (KDO 8-P phosphatase)